MWCVEANDGASDRESEIKKESDRQCGESEKGYWNKANEDRSKERMRLTVS